MKIGIWLVVLVQVAIVSAVAYSVYQTRNIQADRYTATQGKAAERQVNTVIETQREMLQAQEKAFKRIECRQIVFIAANNRATQDFKGLLKGCE